MRKLFSLHPIRYFRDFYQYYYLTSPLPQICCRILAEAVLFFFFLSPLFYFVLLLCQCLLSSHFYIFFPISLSIICFLHLYSFGDLFYYFPTCDFHLFSLAHFFLVYLILNTFFPSRFIIFPSIDYIKAQISE